MRLGKYLEKKGIDISYPGFYDSPEFLELEREDKMALLKYGAFLRQKRFEPAYLKYSKNAVEVLCDEVLKSGMPLRDQCYDISNFVSRVLERAGVWNFVAIGATSLVAEGEICGGHYAYNPEVKRPAHAWIYAPPYTVVDLTLKTQSNHSLELVGSIPEVLMLVSDEIADVGEGTLAHPAYIREYRRSPYPGMYENAIRLLGPSRHNIGQFEVLYVPVGVVASEKGLEGLQHPKTDGKTPAEMFDEMKSTLRARGLEFG